MKYTEQEINAVMSEDCRQVMAQGILDWLTAMTKSLGAFMPKETEVQP